MSKPIARSQSKSRWWITAFCIGLLFISAFPAKDAKAFCCFTSIVSDPATQAEASIFHSETIAQLGIIGELITSVLGIFQFFSTTLLPTGFASVAAAVSGTGSTTAKVIADTGEYEAYGSMYSKQVGLAADSKARGVLANQTSSCAMLQAGQAMAVVDDQSARMAAAQMNIIEALNCEGKNADCRGPGRDMEAMYDLCNLGFISPTATGDMTTRLNCPGPPSGDGSYVDRDKLPFLHTIQMPMATACILQDGYPYFAPAMPAGFTCQGTTVPGTPIYDPNPNKSQYAWIAAYKYCENLQDEENQPQTNFYTTGNRKITSLDAAKFLHGRRSATRRMGAKSVCIKALMDRTACPTASDARGNPAPVGGGGVDCATSQRAVCDALAVMPNGQNADPARGKDDAENLPTVTGVGIDSEPLLVDCLAGAGLSPLAARKIMAYRCINEKWMTEVMPSWAGMASSAKAEEFSQDACGAMQDRFEASLKAEEKIFMNAVFNNRQRTTTGDEEPAPLNGPRPQ